MEEETPTSGRITIAPEVIETVARLTTLAVPGVARLTPPAGIPRMLGIKDGVKVNVSDGKVAVELHIVAESGKDILALARHIQNEVTRAVEDIVGLPVSLVNVTVEDVVPAPQD